MTLSLKLQPSSAGIRAFALIDCHDDLIESLSHLEEKECVGCGGEGEPNGRQKHEDADESEESAVVRVRNGLDAKDKSAGSGVDDAEGIDDAHERLKEKDEEENHEVEGAVVAEGFVSRSEPAHEGGRAKDDKVDDGEQERAAPVAAGKQVEQADDHVGEQQANVC